MQTVHQRDTFPAEMLSANTGSKKRPFVVLSSDFRNHKKTRRRWHSACLLFISPLLFFPSLLITLPSKDRGVVLSCLLVIRHQAGQITQPQSCAFLHGVDWLWSILNGGLCRLKRGWSFHRKLKETALHLVLVGLRKVGRFMTHLRSSCVVLSGTSAGVVWPTRRGKRGDITDSSWWVTYLN
ncbi:hypothetical protein AVEN_183330-1 [Araneus ventricosus]|uniref:Transmembrane protein n=1 Tax=Araneus ventricosus TaxID=182803 RepID=A0A4Y2K0M1_ARAVE|nr:hypothetical protein AVEN_183330-1 [Araneus ventricosus]